MNEHTQSELDDIIKTLRTIMEETVLAGYPGGDRVQTLVNVRNMRQKLAAIADADYVLNVDATWKTIKGALKEAIVEVLEHNSEYRHRTPQEKIDKWKELVK